MDLRQHNTQERIVAGLIDCLEAKPFRELENKDIKESNQWIAISLDKR